MAGNLLSPESVRASLTPGTPRPEGSSAEVIEKWLADKLSELLGVEAREIDLREPFASYGMGSTEAVTLSGELGEWLGQKVPADLAYEFPTIESLARHLSGSAEAPPAAAARSPLEAEPLAIIGIGCRFPGSSSPQEFWDSIRDGVDAITEVPADRFKVDEFYDPDPSVAGKISTRWGGFVAQVDQFDAHFFGISPREAARMDPQQRLLLEVAWEALEDAGVAAEQLAGSPTGVFVGISNNDYGRTRFADLNGIDAYAGTGNALSIAANRVSYLWDLRGPSIAIDTACSSSLVAVDLACASLRRGEATLALAGGVNLILSPAITMNFTKAGVMAPDGRCKAFDARANGYVRSEGAGVIVLKALSRAQADGDTIYAVIRGSAVNQDGRSNGLMAPNPIAQEAVLREAYRRAGVSPGDLQYVEAHGTGTLLGDPIEARALGRVLADGRTPGRLCAIGSVKTNIGHCEAAAGIAGLIKVALALRHEEIPASLHFHEPNPHIPFAELPIRVQTRPGEWSAAGGPPLAGVSSFGFGGTNAHVVLEQAPAPEPQHHAATAVRSAYLLPLSARSPEALHAVARSYRELLAGSASSLHDICYSASARRSHHDYRMSVAGDSAHQLLDGLDAFLQGETRTGLAAGRKAPANRKKMAWVFAGQGAQWFGMGRTLLLEEPIFRAAIERCALALRPHTDWSLIGELAATDTAESRLDEVNVIQPALFAVQVALAALWRSWGIVPDAVIGHSMGEVAAAYVAGALTLEDAALIVCTRSRLARRTVGQGAMAAVELSLEDARRAMAGREDRVSIAVSTSPTSTILSGDPAALAEILEQLRTRDVFCRMVKVDFASHSPQMDPLREELLRALEEIQPRLAAIPLYSTVLNAIADGAELDALYWARNLREPVLFSAALQRLIADGYDTFVEISAHPILLSGIQQGLQYAGVAGTVLATLRRDEDGYIAMLRSLGGLYSSGYPIDWGRIYPAGGEAVRLPAYPWQRQRCWMEPGAAGNDQSDHAQSDHKATASGARKSLLGRHFESAEPGGADYWEMRLSQELMPFLDDHRIAGVAAVPASALIEMASTAAQQVLRTHSIAMAEVEFHRALFLPDGTYVTVQVIVARAADGTASFQIYSSADLTKPNSWTLHASGKVSAETDSALPETPEEPSRAELQLRSTTRLDGADYYRQLGENAIQYGPFFQSTTRLWLDGKNVLGELRISQEETSDLADYSLHPAVLDGCLQVLGAAVATAAQSLGRPGLYLPIRIGQLRIFSRPGEHLWCRARLLEEDSDGMIGDARLLNDAGQVVAELLGVRFALLDVGVKDRLEDWLYELVWRPKERVAENVSTAGPGTWIIFGDRGGVGESLADILAGRGEKSIVVARGEAYQRIDSTHLCVRPGQPDDLARLFDIALDSGQPACRGIVHLWSLDAAPAEEFDAAAIDAAQTSGCINALQLVQQMAGRPWREQPRLWLITQGAQAAGDDAPPVAVMQAPLWGLGRVIAQEHPALWGGLIDLEPQPTSTERTAQRLWEELSTPNGENQIALRDGQRLVARLARRSKAAVRETPRRWRSDGTYLITGGLGDLGLKVARWMIAQGARRLILLGRSQLPPRSSWSSLTAGTHPARQVVAVRELEEAGASVHLVSADVADEQQMRTFIAQFKAEGWPAIRGVVHAAGVIQDGLLLQLDAAAMESVLRPKVAGGWNLHRLLREAPLDFFIVFSSAGALLGQPGQGNYAAANSFLDALAHHRRANGLPALSIDWGAWADLGFAETAGGRNLTRRLALMGIASLPPARALEVMDRLMREDATQVVALRMNWTKYHEVYAAGAEPPLLSDLSKIEAAGQSPAASAGGTRRAILDADAAERIQLLQSYLSGQVARVLGLSPSRVEIHQPLTNLGMDSLMAVELKNRISADLGVNVPMVKFLQGFSVAQAAAELLDQLAAEADRPSTARPLTSARGANRADDDLLSNLDNLSEEQVNSMLADLLTKDAVT